MDYSNRASGLLVGFGPGGQGGGGGPGQRLEEDRTVRSGYLFLCVHPWQGRSGLALFLD